ncbi:MAG: MraY family glycosyltransferase [Peptostreptococcaceae bacterium]|nr:MraY family glycosyltransferase [Peptostreptococcaceae bacterium]
MLKVFLAFVISCFISYLITPFIIKLANKIGAIDVPKDARRVHSKPIPRLGGLGIFIGFLIPSIFLLSPDPKVLAILLSAGIMVNMGIIDDISPLKAKTKLFIQIFCALIITWAGIRIDFFTNPFENDILIVLRLLSIPITVFWIVGITNTVNLIDGLDGLAAGISIIAALTLGIVAFTSGQYVTATLLMGVVGGAVGFLPHNFNPAKIFMGDTGSLFLGFVLSVTSILGTIKGATVLAVIIPIFALAIPILDTTFAIIRRFLAGKPIMEADRGHLHHRLLSKGLSQKKTVIYLYGIAAFLGASSLYLQKSDFITGIMVIFADLMIVLFGVKKLRILEEVKQEINESKHEMDGQEEDLDKKN